MGADFKVTLNLLQLAVTVYLAARVFRSPAALRLAFLALVASVSVVAPWRRSSRAWGSTFPATCG